MMKKAIQDQAIIQGIRAGGPAADQALRNLYQSQRERGLAFLQQQGASSAEAADIFQDAVIAVYENIQSGKFRGDSAVASYLFSVARFIWLNRVKRVGIREKVMDKVEHPEIESSHLPQLLAREDQNKIQDLFGQVGADCQKVLVLSIYQDYSMEEIAVEMNYASKQIARNKKYRCLERLKKWLEQHPQVMQWLRDLKVRT